MNEAKLQITMFSSADSVEGQGVGSAYKEQVRLIEEGASDLFDVRINSWLKHADIQHFHTIDPNFLLKMADHNAVNIAYCHFLPDTLEGSLKIPKLFQPVASSYITTFYKSADRLVVVNPSFIEELVKYGIDRKKIYYIPNFVSKDKFHRLPGKDRAAWRRKYGIALDAFVVLGCGQVQTRKGVLDFVETAKKMPEATFVWAGGFSFGPMTDGYAQLKEIMENHPDNVVFTDIVPREEMVHIYNMADVLFIPSYNELFPMTILEAANLSIPMVIRDLDLYKDILFNNYLKGSSNEEFAELLKALYENPELYEFWKSRSDAIADYYSRDHVLSMWREFYVDAWKEKQAKNGALSNEAL